MGANIPSSLNVAAQRQADKTLAFIYE